MSLNPEVDGILSLAPQPSGVESQQAEGTTAEAPLGGAHASDQALPLVVATPKPTRARTFWTVTAAVTVIGFIAVGSLGYLLYATTGQRDVARQRLAATTLSLNGTKQQVSDLQTDAATRAVTAKYVAAYVANDGPVQSDYAQLGSCQDYGTCRSAAQQTLSDLQAFQAQRSAAIVPANLTNADAMLGDGLSAAIAAVQELISGMDNDDVNKITDGASKLHVAMLSIGKAETALGAGLK